MNIEDYPYGEPYVETNTNRVIVDKITIHDWDAYTRQLLYEKRNRIIKKLLNDNE